MSLQTLKNINRQGNTEVVRQDAAFPAMLEKFKGEIARALPKHINPDRMARIALTAFRQTPALAKCDPRSIFAAVIQSSQMGLEVGLMGEAHLVPFGDQCQLIPGYTGLMKLARQSGQVVDIYAHEVRENDTFDVVLGLDRSLVHQPLKKFGFPASDEDRGEVVGFYAVAKFKDGSNTFTAMSVHDVAKIRDGSRGYQAAKKYRKESIWDTEFVSMGIKTVIRRLCKFLPKSPELAMAIAMDSASEAGKSQGLDLQSVIDGEYTPAVIDEEGAVVDRETGEVLEKEPHPTAQAKQETAASEKRSAKAATSTADAKKNGITAYVEAMEKAQSVESLDEVYIRAETELEGVELEALVREYRRIKSNLGSLI